ncbi:uncharacterized protein LOC143428801 [Xylocopa sonorina]|uniref:uncharacterized protein LOC143428801 n=1 Tax=Xylocopa sonorina TaxID=1818115 RepID=UPI00403AC626
MESRMKLQKSLPPLVEGKIHGYLKLVVDEVIWSKRNFSEVRVLISWWGETSRTEFRPVDITKNVTRPIEETTEIYAIRTNINLFEEYIKNCESIELMVVSEETNQIIGTSQVTDLLEIFKCKSYFRYIPIISNCGTTIGEIHISMKLEHMTKSFNNQLRTHRCEKKQVLDNSLLLTINSLKNQHDMKVDRCTIAGRMKPEDSESYKSILRLRKPEFQEPVKKFNNNVVTDKLVARVVARAQKLRGALLKETYDEDEFNSSNNSINNSLQAHMSMDDEVKLDECFLDKDMASSDGNKTLCKQSLADLASNSLKSVRYGIKNSTSNVPSTRTSSLQDTFLRKQLCTDLEDTELLDFIHYIRINIESFTLSPAGYRRVKSSSLLHNDNTFLSATYFIQYDMTFDYIRQYDKKWIKEKKPIKICSNKQTHQAIYFNHNTTYRVSKSKYYAEWFIKFKVFVRHMNKKTLIELGNAVISINDVIKCKNWRFEQQLSIINKGIRIGELSIVVELGSDPSYCSEKQYINSVTSAKENIPNLQTQQLVNENRNKKSKSTARNQSTSDNELQTIPVGVTDSLGSSSDLISSKNLTQFKTENTDDKNIDAKHYEVVTENKVLLHGLIYVAEGQELPELNTYLICRAFWKEDKSRSQVCNNTKNPFYQFFQLVPLIYDSDLLDRIKDNYIIIEVYSKKNNIDNLLGLSKLSVHQLYIAYRDPRVLPHLLLSKYPVVSVDEWVPIMDPVTGQSCGQLLALVALGSAEQIALLEMSRNLRNIGTVSQTIHFKQFSDYMTYSQDIQQCKQEMHDPQISDINTVERNLYFSNFKTQECQTDISTVKEYKFNGDLQKKLSNSKYSTEHDTVDNSRQFLNVNTSQAVQTEGSLEKKEQACAEEHMCMNELNFNNSSDESDNSSVRHNFHLPIETYRSVGVGAEYNEEIDQQSNTDHNNTTFELPTLIHTENESTNSTYSQTVFRAIMEIECALHLPKIEKINETIEPSTYVSFHANKSGHTKRSNSCITTNIFPHNCNPKWNWKCDTELPIELLLHNEKRLILKVWRILDAEVNMQINLEKDIVIGFSAIDLSVLLSGFPTVSGWFHIMDFTGKCNGQIKICITPLDNLSLFGKPTITLNTTRLLTQSMPQLNWIPLHTHEMYSGNVERNSNNYTLSTVTQEEKSLHSETQSNESITHIDLEDVSTSFLSLSLKQKLTELDEITKRLESRLRDVTNMAFEDDLENEFDSNEPNSDAENNDYKITASVVPNATTNYNSRMYQISQIDRKLLHTTETKENENQNTSIVTSIENFLPQTDINCKKIVTCEIMKPNTSKISNSCNKQYLSNDDCEMQQQSEHSMQSIKTFDNTFIDYPERGTKMHINYLLDKLSLQFPAQSYLTKSSPRKRNVTNLLSNLQLSNNNLQDSDKCNQDLKVCTVPTQTDDIYEQTITNSEVTSCTTDQKIDSSDRNSVEALMQPQITNKMSTVIREELITEENSNTSKCDELTTYLLTSNVRHMDLNNIFSPLLYQHLVPDLYYPNTSPDEETVKQLDNRYSKVFNRSIDKTLNEVHNLREANMSSENAELYRATPSGVSENIDDSIDLTILHKSSDNDLLASNSTESTTTISVEKSLMKSIDSDLVENCNFTFPETSILVLSRQAPDGGNPVEDAKKPLIAQQNNQTQYSSSGCN